MLIICPTCESRYDIATEAIGRGGRSVRCSRCRTEWRVFADGDIAAAEEPSFDMATDEPATQRIEEAIDAQALEDGLAPPPPPRPKARRARRPSTGTRKPRSPAWWAVGAAAVAIAVIVFAREAVVRVAPQTAGLFDSIGLGVNLRGLDFGAIKTQRLIEGGLPVLVVEGVIRNVSARPMPVPRLRIGLRDEAATEVYSWTALISREALPPGETLPFRTRLASPPEAARSAEVRFLARHDMVAPQEDGS